MWMWILGIVLLVIGVVLFLLRRSEAAKLSQVLATETSTCAQLSEQCEGMAGHLGTAAGALVEAKGTIHRGPGGAQGRSQRPQVCVLQD